MKNAALCSRFLVAKALTTSETLKIQTQKEQNNLAS